MVRGPLATAISLVLALAGVGCGAEETLEIDAESVVMPTNEVLGQDTSYMAWLFDQRTNGLPFLQLDLEDPRQYQFVLNRLLRAGKTPANSPRLFQNLRKVRAEHRAAFATKSRADGVKGSGEVTTESHVGGGGSRCGHFLVVPNSMANGVFHADPSARESCWDGMDFVALDLAIYESNENETYHTYLNGSYIEDYAGVEVITPTVRGSVAINPYKAVVVDSFGYAADDTTGDAEFTYVKYKTDVNGRAIIRAGSAGALIPGILGRPCTGKLAAGLQSDESCTLSQPRDVTGDDITRLCYQRTFTAGTGDCDLVAVNDLNEPGVPPFTYIAQITQNASGQWVPSTTERWPIPAGADISHLLLPVVGEFDIGTKMEGSSEADCHVGILDMNKTHAAVRLRGTGGWCAGNGTDLPDDGGAIYRSLRRNLTELTPTRFLPFGTYVGTGVYDPLIDFGTNCLANLQDACLELTITAVTQNCKDPDTNSRTRTASCEVCFDVRNSCFAAGTKIRRPDGTTVPVETVKVGEQIVANEFGTLLTVTATTRGVELEPMVRLKDSLGHELLLTAKHPVITTVGAVAADQITTMSQVQTEDGIASIVEVERVPYDGMVYNLSVGTPEEIAMVSGLNRTMFAGGIRVGDNEMQFDMERQSVRERVKRALSEGWEIDRKNATARTQAAGK